MDEWIEAQRLKRDSAEREAVAQRDARRAAALAKRKRKTDAHDSLVSDVEYLKRQVAALTERVEALSHLAVQ